MKAEEHGGTAIDAVWEDGGPATDDDGDHWPAGGEYGFKPGGLTSRQAWVGKAMRLPRLGGSPRTATTASAWDACTVS